jgi:hypothetical protein
MFSLLGCQTKNSPKKVETSIEVKTKETQYPAKEIWGLTNYLDTIVEQKELAKYRLQTPSWFGILLEISPDSITSYGSILEIEGELINSEDTLYQFESFAGKWILLKEEEQLLLKQVPNPKASFDATIYVYRKRNDLEPLLKRLDKVHKISTNMTQYFNEKLLSGIYNNNKTKQEVRFNRNGTLSGLKSFTHFQIRDYFGTHHPHKNLDVVFLKNPKDKIFKQFHWTFDKSNLILTEFIFKEQTESYILGKNKIVLEKKKEIQ